MNHSLTKLVIGIPWDSPFVWSDCAESVANLEHPRGYEVHTVFGKGWCPARRHADCCERALELGAELILILGGDQVFERDLLTRLTAHYEAGISVITALVPTRGYLPNQQMRPFQPLAWRFKNDTGKPGRFISLHQTPEFCEQINPDDGTLQRVDFIGSGVLMFHVDLLHALTLPWFSETVDHKTYSRLAVMDCGFVWRLQTEGGARPMVDTTINVKHIHDLQIDSSFQYKFSPEDLDSELCSTPHQKFHPLTSPSPDA